MNKTLLQKFPLGITLLFILIEAIVIYLIFRYSPMQADAAYYLLLSREIAEGTRPYIDVEVVYTPFSLYLNSLVFLLSNKFEYYRFILVQLLIVGACSFTLYQIFNRRFYLQRWTSLFLATLFFSAMLSFEGYYTVTEPYVVLFILMSFYLCYQNQSILTLMLSGFILAFAFFSKQYGILAIVPFSLLIYTSSKKKINLFYFIASFSLSVLGFFILFSKGNVPLVFNQLFVQPMVAKSKNLNDFPSFTSSLLIGKVFFCTALPLIIRLSKKFRPVSPVIMFGLCGILIYLLPLAINQYQHYFINTLPFVFIAYGYSIRSGNWKLYEKILLGILFLLFSLITINRLRVHAFKKQEQINISRKISKQYRTGESVYVVGQARYLYLANNYHDPLKKELDFTWDDKRVEQSKKLLDDKNLIFSSCYDKQLFIDSLKVQPRRFICIEDCAYSP